MSATRVRLQAMAEQAVTPQDHLDVIRATSTWLVSISRLDEDREFKREIKELANKIESLERRITSKLAAG